MSTFTILPGAVAAARDAAPVESVPIEVLKPADSPRLHGIVLEHVRHLAGSAEHLPPILVHRQTMRVVDGMHRLRVAQIKGEREILVAYFDGDAEDAFIQAVFENNTFGLPLQLSDRKAAALRILTAHSDWSDRSIGKTAHLSAKTVALIRRAAGTGIPQPTARLGQDGRRRSLRTAGDRRRSDDVLTRHNPAPIRPVVLTREAPSYADRRRIPEPPGAVRGSVPAQYSRQQATLRNPGPGVAGLADFRRAEADRSDSRGSDSRGSDSQASAHLTANDPACPAVSARTQMDHLLRDPSLRFTDSGRSLLRKLIAGAGEAEEWDRLAAVVPERCAAEVAELAAINARAWLQFAELVREAARDRRTRARTAALGRRVPRTG